MQVWLKFKRWLRTLALELSQGKRIDWWIKINELTAIVNLWLDRKTDSSSSTELPVTTPPSPKPRRGLFWRLRNRKSTEDG